MPLVARWNDEFSVSDTGQVYLLALRVPEILRHYLSYNVNVNHGCMETHRLRGGQRG